MSIVFRRRSDATPVDNKDVPTSETDTLIIGTNRMDRRRRFRRRLCHFFFAAVVLVSLFFIGQGIFAYRFTRSHVECVPYKGGTTVVKLPALHTRFTVLLDPSVSSHDATVTHVESGTKEITVTLKEDSDFVENSEIRLCTLKSYKLGGVGLYAGKGHPSLPVIKSLKVEVPTGPSPGVALLPPKRRYRKLAKFFEWAGVWNPKNTKQEDIRLEEMFE